MPDVPDPLADQGQRPKSFEVPSALPSVLARVLAFSAVIVASICGGLMGLALARLQWGETEKTWVIVVKLHFLRYSTGESGMIVESFS